MSLTVGSSLEPPSVCFTVDPECSGSWRHLPGSGFALSTGILQVGSNPELFCPHQSVTWGSPCFPTSIWAIPVFWYATRLPLRLTNTKCIQAVWRDCSGHTQKLFIFLSHTKSPPLVLWTWKVYFSCFCTSALYNLPIIALNFKMIISSVLPHSDLIPGVGLKNER